MIPSVNKPTILLGLSVPPLCRFRLKSADYWARLTVSRSSFICLPSLENGYNVQQKGITISQQRPQDKLPVSEGPRHNHSLA